MIQILMVDDSEIVRHGLRDMRQRRPSGGPVRSACFQDGRRRVSHQAKCIPGGGRYATASLAENIGDDMPPLPGTNAFPAVNWRSSVRWSPT
jgi:hypothetical protein